MISLLLREALAVDVAAEEADLVAEEAAVPAGVDSVVAEVADAEAQEEAVVVSTTPLPTLTKVTSLHSKDRDNSCEAEVLPI